jgi:tetratricopeptide (TPR) repeat protein
MEEKSSEVSLVSAPQCPHCGSQNTLFKTKANQYECLDCERRFEPPRVAGSHSIVLTQKTTDPRKIFFSYGHDKNKALVDLFKADLEKRGHSVWIDYKEIGVWADWRDNITKGINDSQMAIAFLSKHATRDPGVCRQEVAMALNQFHTVYPALLEPESEVTAPVTISHIQWQDLSLWQDIHEGTVPGEVWPRWYEKRLIELIDLVESKAGHFAGEVYVLDRILQPLSFTSEIVRHIPGFTGRQWVFEAYQDWLERQPQSRLFWLQAGPGVGKTALAAVLANNHPSAIVSAWFCRSDSIERRDARRAIQTIALQLAARLPDYRTRLLQALVLTDKATDADQKQAIEALNKLNATDLFHQLIKQPLQGLIPRAHKLVILIDALDEATDEQGNNALTDLLVQDLAALPDWLGFVVTSRPDPAIVNRLAGFEPFILDAENVHNQADLTAYIQYALQQRPELRDLPAERQDAITAALLGKSEGMMLYLRLTFEGYDAKELRAEDLLDTPKGLGGLYSIQFRQRFAAPSLAVYTETVRPLLRLLLAALGPLPEGLARQVLGDDRETGLKRRNLLGSYLVRQGEGLQLFHKTLGEWLQSDQAGDFIVDSDKARKDLAEALWKDCQDHQETPLQLTWKEPVIQWLPQWLRILFPEPMDEAKQASVLGTFLQGKLAEYRAAEPLYRRALEIQEQILGPEHPDTATSLNNLAILLDAQGKLAAAEPLYRRTLEIQEKVLGPEHPDTATSLNELASLLQAQGKLVEAEPLYRRALEIQEKVLGPEHPDTAHSLNDLASLLYAQSKLAEAEPLLRRALEIQEKVLGPEHPDTAAGLNNLAALLQAQGKLAEVEPLFRRALEIQEKVLGPEHPITAIGLNSLAGLLYAQGKPAEAAPLYRRSLEIREKVLGPEHPDTAKSLNNLAVLLHAQGKLAEVEPLLRRAQEIREKVLGPEHPDTANSLSNLAGLLQDQGKLAEAEPLYRRALEIQEKVLGPEHPITAIGLNSLASLLYAQGKPAGAEPLYRQSLEILQKTLGPEHPKTIDVRNSLELLLTPEKRNEAS